MKKSAAHNSSCRFGSLSQGRQLKPAPFHSPLTNDSSDFGLSSAGTRPDQGTSPHPLTCTGNSQLVFQCAWWKTEHLNSRKFACYQRSHWPVPSTSYGRDCGRPYGNCIVIHRTNELLIKQKTGPDRQAISSIVERAYEYNVKGWTRTYFSSYRTVNTASP